MATPKKTQKKGNGLEGFIAALEAEGTDFDVLRYSNGFVDVMFTSPNGTRVKHEFKDTGAELVRDAFGKEVE